MLSPSLAMRSRQARQIGCSGSSLISQPATTGISAIEQIRQAAQDAALGLSAQPQQNEIVARQQRIDDLRNDRVFVAVHTREKRLAAFDGAQQDCARISSFTERDAARASKSGMRRNSPSVAGCRRVLRQSAAMMKQSFSPRALPQKAALRAAQTRIQMQMPSNRSAQFNPWPLPAACSRSVSALCRCGAHSRRYATRRSWRSASVRNSRIRCFQSKIHRKFGGDAIGNVGLRNRLAIARIVIKNQSVAGFIKFDQLARHARSSLAQAGLRDNLLRRAATVHRKTARRRETVRGRR